MHPVLAFACLDVVLRMVPLAWVDPSLLRQPWAIVASPGFAWSIASDVFLAGGLWQACVLGDPVARSRVRRLTVNAALQVALHGALHFAVFAGLALIVADAMVHAVSARHLHQVPANNVSPAALWYILKIPHYAAALGAAVVTVVGAQVLLIGVARAWSARGVPGDARRGLMIRSFAKLVLCAAVAAASARPVSGTGQAVANAPSTRPVIDLAMVLWPSRIQDSPGNRTDVVPVAMSDAELDLVASIGLPARARGVEPNPAVARLRELPPKVILVTVESLARDFVGKFHVPRRGFTLPAWVTPSLDKLAGESISFNAHGTTMMPTQPGLYTTLLSRCVLHDHEVAPRDHRPLAEVLRDAGYEASYFQGAEMGYGRMDYYSPMIFRYASRNGYQEILAGGAEPGHAWGWGLHDDVVFDAAWQAISADPAKRQFVHILTVDTHPPFGSEQEFADAPAGFRGADPMFRGLYATDRAIGRLMGRMEASGLMGRGALVIVTADHSPSHLYSQYMPDNPRMLNDRIPLFIKHRDLAPGSVAEAITSRMSSQIDVAPTIVSLMGLEIPRSWAGRNLFDPATLPLWVSNEDPIGVANQTVEFKLPGDRIVRVPSRGELPAGQGGDVALAMALQKWLILKHEESMGESRADPGVVPARPGTPVGGGVPAPLVAVMPGGIRVLRPAGETYMPRVDEWWAGGPIVLGGVRRRGVAFRVPGRIVVEVPPGTRVLSGQFGVMPFRTMIHRQVGHYEWKVTVPDGPGGPGGPGGARGPGRLVLASVAMPVEPGAVRDFRVDLPPGMTGALMIELRRADTGDNLGGYDEGFVGGLVAGW